MLAIPRRAAKREGFRYFDWFLIDGDKVDTKKVNYQCFAACDYMPKWNTSCEEVQHFLIGVALHYMKEYGVDGWRLDVSDEVSHDSGANSAPPSRRKTERASSSAKTGTTPTPIFGAISMTAS